MKKVKIVLFVLITFFVARELLPFDISWFKENSVWSSNHTYNFNTTRTSKKGFSPNIKFQDYDFNTEPNLLYFGLQDNSSNLKGSSVNQIEIFVSNMTSISWTRYVPIFKIIDFNSLINYTWRLNINLDENVQIAQGSGTITITGSKDITGICSAKKATALINYSVEKEIKKEVEKTIEKEWSKLK